MHEAHGFNFSSLENGAQLQRQFASFVGKLRKMRQRGLVEVNRHRSRDLGSLAFKKMFFVQVPPGSSKETLVMADLDHVYNLQKAFESDPVFRKIAKKMAPNKEDLRNYAYYYARPGKFGRFYRMPPGGKRPVKRRPQR